MSIIYQKLKKSREGDHVHLRNYLTIRRLISTSHGQPV